MCVIINPYTTEKSVTGYKVVTVDEHGHYYSPYTGMRYKKGKVKSVDISTVRSRKYCTSSSIIINDSMAGYTGVFLGIDAASNILNSFESFFDTKYKFCIVTMTITGNLQNASALGYCTVIGNTIIDIKKEIRK